MCNFSGVYEAQGFLQWMRDKGAEVNVLEMSDIEGTNCYCDTEARRMIAERLSQCIHRPMAEAKDDRVVLREPDRPPVNDMEQNVPNDAEAKNDRVVLREPDRPIATDMEQNVPNNAEENVGKDMEETGVVRMGRLPMLRWIDSGDYHYVSHILAKMETEPFHLLLLDNHPDNQEPAFPGILSCGSWVKAMREENANLMDVLWIGPQSPEEGIEECKKWMSARKDERLYLSLDKDIMAKDWARTDWSQGEYTLAQVQRILKLAMETMRPTAIDICGEMAESKGATPEDMRINFETNTKLYQFICQN